MVARYYSVQYGGDPAGAVNSGIAAGGSTRHIEIKFEMGANSSSAEYAHLKNNRDQVLAELQELVDRLGSGKEPWPPSFS